MEPNNTNQNSSGFGFQFKSAREEKKLHIEDVAKEINILPRHLEAIERNDFDSLPQLAFTKGFVSSYAKYLKLDVNNIMNHFNSVYPASDSVPVAELNSPLKVDKNLGDVSRNNQKKTSFGGLGLFFAIIGLLGIGFVYFSSIKKAKKQEPNTQNQTVIEQMSGDMQTETSQLSTNSQTDSQTVSSAIQANQSVDGLTAQQNTENTNAEAGQVSTENADFIEYKVKRGDGLIALANKNNIPVAKLAELNGLKTNQDLLLGQIIKIPKTQTP